MQNLLDESLEILLSLNLTIWERLNIHIQNFFPIHFLIVHVAQHFYNFAPTFDMTFDKSREHLASVLGLRDG